MNTTAYCMVGHPLMEEVFERAKRGEGISLKVFHKHSRECSRCTDAYMKQKWGDEMFLTGEKKKEYIRTHTSKLAGPVYVP